MAPARAAFSEIKQNTGINTGIPVLFFSNTEIPVLPNVVGIGGPTGVPVGYSAHAQPHPLVQWYQMPEFVLSNSNSGLHSCISISIYTQNVT